MNEATDPTDSTHRADVDDLAEVDLRSDADRWTLVFVRHLRHPVGRVRDALVQPGQLAEWAPFDADRELDATGPVVLTMATPDGTPGDVLASEVLEVEVPHRLEYRWGDDVLRWDLAPDAAGVGTVLTLHHTLADRDRAAETAAGWHLCLDVAERSFDGERGGRIVGAAAMDHGWEALRDAYRARLAG